MLKKIRTLQVLENISALQRSAHEYREQLKWEIRTLPYVIRYKQKEE